MAEHARENESPNNEPKLSDISSEKPPTITLNHLKHVLSIIEISVKKGAFLPDELEVVGNTYKSIKNFLIHTLKTTESNNIAEEASNTIKEV